MKNRPRRKKSKAHRHPKKLRKVARRASPKRQQRKPRKRARQQRREPAPQLPQPSSRPQPERRREFFDPVFAGAAKHLTTEEAGGDGVGESGGEGGAKPRPQKHLVQPPALPAPQLLSCPNCRAFMFQSDSSTWKCPNCGHTVAVG